MKNKIDELKIENGKLRTQNYVINNHQQGKKRPDDSLVYMGRIGDSVKKKGPASSVSESIINIYSVSVWVTVVLAILITYFVIFSDWISVFSFSATLKEVAEVFKNISYYIGGMSKDIDKYATFIKIYAYAGYLIPCGYAIYVYYLFIGKSEKKRTDWKEYSCGYNILYCIGFVILFMWLQSVIKQEVDSISGYLGNATDSLIKFKASVFIVLILGIVVWFSDKIKGGIVENNMPVVSKSNIGENTKKYSVPVMNYYPIEVFRIVSIDMYWKNGNHCLVLKTDVFRKAICSAKLTIDFIDDLGEIYRLKDCRIDMNDLIDKNEIIKSDQNLKSKEYNFEFSQFPMRKIEKAMVYVDKYFNGQEMVECDSTECNIKMSKDALIGFREKNNWRKGVVTAFEQNGEIWTCACGSINASRHNQCWNCEQRILKQK